MRDNHNVRGFETGKFLCYELSENEFNCGAPRTPELRKVRFPNWCLVEKRIRDRLALTVLLKAEN